MRILDPAEVTPFPAPARAGDWVSCLGFDADRVLFMSTPNAELAGRVPVDLITIERRTGVTAGRSQLTFDAIDGAQHDWFEAISFHHGVAITRRGRLVALDDGEVRCSFARDDGDGRSFWAFSRDERRLLWVRRAQNDWTYSVHESRSGAEQARARGTAPMMTYVDETLASLVVVGGGRAYRARHWRTDTPKMKLLAIPEKGEPIFSPDLSRWMVWKADDMVVGDSATMATRAFALPQSIAQSDIRYRLGNESLIVAATSGEDLRVIAIALATGEAHHELDLRGAAGVSAPPHLDPSGRWVLFAAREGVRLWPLRRGSREPIAVRGPKGSTGAFAIAGMNVASTVACGSGGPWTEGGFTLIHEKHVAFYALP